MAGFSCIAGFWGRGVFLMLGCIGLAFAAAEHDWPGYGGGPEDIRYSPLKQIDRDNVAQLEVAWTYDAADGAGDPQTQPIMVDGILYGVTPAHKIVALDAATGKLLWKFDPGIRGRGPNRGLAFWSSGSDRRIFADVQSFIYALDARTGKTIPGFGTDGRIDVPKASAAIPQNNRSFSPVRARSIRIF